VPPLFNESQTSNALMPIGRTPEGMAHFRVSSVLTFLILVKEQAKGTDASRHALVIRFLPYSHQSTHVAHSYLGFMSVDEFTEVERLLQETVSELKQANDPAIKRLLLADMRRLLAEADRLMLAGRHV
jgi:hypothetical protein